MSSSSISSSRVRAEVVARQPVDRAVQLERVERRQVPLELVAVAHHERHPAQVLALAPRRDVAEHAALAGGRVEQAGEHLQRRRLAGAVRAEEADHLAGVDPNEMPSTARTSRHWRRTRLRRDARRPASRSGTRKTLVSSVDLDDPARLRHARSIRCARAHPARLADVSRARRARPRHVRRAGRARARRARTRGRPRSARHPRGRAGAAISSSPPARRAASRPDVVYAHFLVPSGLIAALGGARAARRHGARPRRPQHRRAARRRGRDAARRPAGGGRRVRVGVPAPRARDEAARGAREDRGRLERCRPGAVLGRAAARRAAALPLRRRA